VTMTERIIQALHENPDRTSREIAYALGANADYVRTVASRQNIRINAGRRRRARLTMIRNDNYTWLEAEAEKNSLRLGEMLDAVITDARVDDMAAENA